MSDNSLLVPVLLQIRETMRLVHNILVEILGVLRTGFQAMTSIQGVTNISKIGRSTFGIQEGIKGQDDFLAYLQKIFSGNVFQPLAPPTAAPANKKSMKGIKDIFKEVGKSIMAAFDPVMLLFQILQPIVSAVLEPLEMLTPLLESWGMILAQLLYPIIELLLMVLEPLTPVLQQLIDAILPLITLLVMLVEPLIPLITLISQILVLSLTFAEMGTSLISVLGNVGSAMGAVIGVVLGVIGSVVERVQELPAMLADFFNGLRDSIADWFSNVKSFLVNKFETLLEPLEDWLNNMRQKLIDKLTDIFDVDWW